MERVLADAIETNKPIASVKAHFTQINLFPCLKLESAIRAELDLALNVGVKKWSWRNYPA
jgi:hypothetical protein